MLIDYEKREAAMCRDYLAGYNSPALAERYGITRERVRQILKPHGVIAERQKQRAQKKMERDAARFAKVYDYERRRKDAVEMVENGVSIAKACRAVRIGHAALKTALGDSGVKSIHGRWRDQTVLRRRVAELIAAGKKPRRIKKILDGENLKVSVHWIYDHFGAELRAFRAAKRLGIRSPDVNYLNESAVAEARERERLPANDNSPAQDQQEAA